MPLTVKLSFDDGVYRRFWGVENGLVQSGGFGGPVIEGLVK